MCMDLTADEGCLESTCNYRPVPDGAICSTSATVSRTTPGVRSSPFILFSVLAVSVLEIRNGDMNSYGVAVFENWSTFLLLLI